MGRGRTMKKTIVITVEDGTVNLHTNDMGSIEELIVTLAAIFERACREGGYEPLSSLEKCMDEEDETKPDPEEYEYWDDWEDDYDCCDICGQYYSDCDCD